MEKVLQIGRRFIRNTFMENIQKKRHSLAHLLAAAVLQHYPNAKLTIGPATKNGFYYDIDFEDKTITTDTLKTIHKTMKKLINSWSTFEKQEVTATEAKEIFAGNQYKLELIEEIEKAGEAITLYKSGDFVDLCKGGHVDHMNEIEKGSYLLDSLAGAYWRGNEQNATLTRIYGLAFDTKEELDNYLAMREEAKKRDHRKLGKELDLFHFSDLVGPGLPLFTPKGTLLRNLLDDFVWKLRKKYGYEKVEIPHICKKDLFVTSGHWDKFSDELFKIVSREGHEFAMKPMNCPFHTQIYARKLHSYKELPQRYANTTMCYRDEQTGELHGLSRLRGFTQDDAHVFCRESQFIEEALNIWNIIEEFYKKTGFGELKIRLSLRDPEQPEKYKGSDEVWEKSENQLREIIAARGVEFLEGIGEAAFYGPKIDFISEDALGREWQVATIQADRSMPESFDLSCVNEQGEKERIIMIHAAIMGAIERFLSVLIEHHGGHFPLWLAPTQIAILPVSPENHGAFAQELFNSLLKEDIRVELLNENESLGKRIRKSKTDKIPYIIVIGDNEVESNTFNLEGREDKHEELLVEDIVKFVKDSE